MAEDIGDFSDIEARVLAASGRAPGCGTCEWLATRPADQQALFDRLMAYPVKVAGHMPIWNELVKLGYPMTRKSVEDHRNRGHRRG